MSQDDIKELKSLIGAFVGETQKLVTELGSTIQEHASRGMQLLDLETRRQELAEAQSALGRAVFDLHASGELSLPEALVEQIERIESLSKEVDALQSAADAESDAEPDPEAQGV